MALLSQERKAILEDALAEARRVTFDERGLPVVDGKELPVISGQEYALDVRQWAAYFREEVPQAFLPILAEADRKQGERQASSGIQSRGIWERDGFAETAALRGE